MRQNIKKLSVLGLTFIFAALGIVGWNFLPKASGQNRVPLFSLSETPQKKADETSIASVRESEINFNLAGFTPENSSLLSFPLFDGKTYEAVRNKAEGVEVRGAGDFTWRGKLFGTGEFRGDVLLTVKNGFVSGLIYAPNAVYEIVPRKSKQILVEINQSEFPECGGEIKPRQIETNVSQNDRHAATAQIDSGDRIDVLIVYTTAVKNFFGGDAQAQAFAQQAVATTNTVYRNSQIRQRLRLAHAQEIVYTESGTGGTDLSSVRTNAEVNALRETHKADLVGLVVNTMDACGIGYLMNVLGTGFSPYGYTVTARNCAVGNLSLAHEFGHNMGSAHNPENSTGAAFPYSHGHYVNGVFRTVMSYTDPCTSGCPRAPYLSNPSISFNGYPTGIANQRDNVRSINNTADTVASFRYSGSNLTLNNFNNGEQIPRNLSRTITWSSENLTGNVRIEISRDGGTTYTTLIANTPNDGAETINVYGRTTRQARLRIVSIDNPHVTDSSVNNIVIR
jgi:hypothetical protein